VEDEPAVGRILSIIAGHAGFQPHCVSSAEEAQELLQRTTPCLLIVDVRLPGMDGVEFVRRVRKKGGHPAPILLISVYPEPEGHMADDFIPKPFEFSDLISRLQSLAEIFRREET
jgi:DNA-binding response OmpR family regulator